MLELKQIVKDYPAGSGTVNALKGIDLRFRKNEFVSILGPSGCGKTTMLNIIGGLDHYTSGDLIINGRSTKDFKDRDWDAYRNHSIGFVFQSYNLIPHQTVLQNVELALTLSGVSRKERRARAKKALEDVGLGDQLSKKPGQMSGGQMQRVAIARALVNDPDIILADEPTGALDTETSVQVMDILKTISQRRLVIMVTHNPDLAEQYSTRIIRMLDGVITADSMPVQDQEIAPVAANTKKVKKPSMKLPTAFMLSFKNLFSKKGRTLLTSFAGSIGIIGIALIFAVSQGMTTYINTVQEETLSSYPITIQEQTVDISSLMLAFMDAAKSSAEHEKDAVYKKAAMYDMVNALNQMDMQENDLRSFRAYLQQQLSQPEGSTLYGAISGVQYSYDLPLLIYTKNITGDIIASDSSKLMAGLIGEYMGTDMTALLNPTQGSGVMGSMMNSSMAMSQNSMKLWQEMLPGKDGSLISDVLQKQYDVVYGSWPNSYDEIVLVLDKNNELDDMTLYAMGLMSEEEISRIMNAAMDGGTLETNNESWSYQDICNREYKVILNSDCYVYDEVSGLYRDLRETDAGIRYLYDNAMTLRVTGIIRPKEDASAAMLSGALAYTSKLTEHVITKSQKSDAIEAQWKSPTTDVITGLPFSENTGNLTTEEKAAELRAYLGGLNENEKAAAYVRIQCIPSPEMLSGSVQQAMEGLTRADMEQNLMDALTTQMGVSGAEITSYVTAMSDEELSGFYEEMIAQQVRAQYAQQVMQQMAGMPAPQLAGALDMALPTYTEDQCATYYDEIMEFSDSSLEENLLALGYVDLEKPSTVNLFASSFANKDVIEEVIAQYNEGKPELEKIKYTDYIGIMLSSITTIINAITYVLISFVAISLVVSSIMIGVITLISVQERTKEIGILRAIGASKKNVSSMFTAETVIIGFTSGLLGVGVTYLLCIPIDALVQYLTEIPGLHTILPIPVAVVLVGISMVLTLISGIIPAKSAAKKDPVVALRTE